MRAWRYSGLLTVVLGLLLAGCSSVPYSGGTFRSGYHEVRRGETLYSIAWRFGLNYHELARWNDIAPPYTLYPGQELRMNPPPGRVYASAAPPAAVNPTLTRGAYSPRRTARPAPARTTPTRGSTPGASTSPGPSSLHWIWPAKGSVTRGFSKGPSGNRGINITGRLGEPVLAAAAGQVVYSGDGLPSYGKLLIIQHNDHYLTAYAHNQKLLVHEGDVVKQGQEIATMGRTGTNVRRPTLHFEIRRDGEPLNPLLYLPRQHN